MKKSILFSAVLLFISVSAFSQANGSLYTVQLGPQILTFKFKTGLDPAKPKSILTKHLILQDEAEHFVDTKYFQMEDTIVKTDPVTNEKDMNIQVHKHAKYHVETHMAYFDFLQHLKSKFELSGTSKPLHTSSFKLYYESETGGGIVEVKFPDTGDNIISKLDGLDKGGFVLLSLEGAERDQIDIDDQGRFMALIHIKKSGQ